MTTTRDGVPAIPAPTDGRRVSPTDEPTEQGRNGEARHDGAPDDGALLAELAHALREVRLGRFDVRLARRDGVAGATTARGPRASAP